MQLNKTQFGLFLTVFVFWCLGNTGCQTAKNEYTPSFKESVFEIITGQTDGNLHVYYQTNSPAAAGQKIDDVVFLKVSTDSGTGKPVLKFPDNKIDVIHSGFVEFILPMQNIDCLATYKAGALVPSFRLEINSWLPTPSDAWMCKGFDFKNYSPVE